MEEGEKKQVQFQEGEAKTLSIGNLVRSFQDDKPSISDAMKNLLSVLMAEDVTAGPDDLSQKDNPAHLLACAKAILKRVNGFILEPPDVWASKQTTTAANELPSAATNTNHDVNSRYEVCHRLMERVRETPEAVPTKLFGWRFFEATRCSKDVLVAARRDLESLGAASVPPESIDRFFSSWAQAVDGRGTLDVGLQGELQSLVWSTDLKASIRAKRAARQREVKERNSRLVTIEKKGPGGEGGYLRSFPFK